MVRDHDDEHKLATIERFLKDLGVTEELKEKNVVEERTVNPAEIAAGVGAGGDASWLQPR